MQTVLRPLFAFVFIFLVWFFIPSLAQAQWVLVYSAEDQFCQHMLQRVNEDAQQNGDVDPSRYPEVQAIQWSSENHILDNNGRGLLTDKSTQNRLTIADVNNDGIDEIAQIYESSLSGGGGDYKPFFRYYPVSLEERIYQTGITSIDLASHRLSDSIYSTEGVTNYNGSLLKLINLPIQSIYTNPAISDEYSQTRYLNFNAEGAEIFPLIYEDIFYVSMVGVSFVGGSYNKYVVRKYDIENKVSDVCYLLNLSL